MTSYADTDTAELIWSPADHPGEFVIKFRFEGETLTEVLPREKVVALIGDFIRELSEEEQAIREGRWRREAKSGMTAYGRGDGPFHLG
jgi:hypothetical protein